MYGDLAAALRRRPFFSRPRRAPSRFVRPGFEPLEMRALVTHMIGEHIHPTLRILIEGEEIPIPADIGITPTRTFHPHTHDDTGVLHIGEGPIVGLDPPGSPPRLTTLEDFFDVWRTTNVGTPRNNPHAFFSENQILDRVADANHEVRMTVNGVPTFEFEDYSPHDLDEIVISLVEIETENGVPTADSQELEIPFGAERSITLTGDDGDPDRVQPLSFRISAIPSHGTLRDSAGAAVTAGAVLSSPSVTYTPNPQFAGSDGFTFLALDGGEANGVSAPATISLQVAANSAPSAEPQAVNVRFNTPRNITLAGDDGDAGVAQSLSFRIRELPQHGTLRDSQGNLATAGAVLPSPQLTYTPNDGFSGGDRFLFAVQDDGGTAAGGQDTGLGAVDLQVVNSIDPNDIVGPPGIGPEHWIAGSEPLPLMVRFENYAQATAPAQEVFVHTTLDPDLDWSSFQFGDIGFGQTVIDVPEGAQSFDATIELAQGDGTMLQVDIAARLNAETGMGSWSLRAIDPATGALPEDPLTGFLPPNQADHRGEGFLQFTVQPRADRDVGTRIDCSAAITFDLNPAMRTNELFYTLGGETLVNQGV